MERLCVVTSGHKETAPESGAVKERYCFRGAQCRAPL